MTALPDTLKTSAVTAAVTALVPLQLQYPSSPDELAAIEEDLATRLLARTVASSLTGCWRWVGAMDKDGYGLIRVNGRHRAAHRMAYVVARGPIADWLTIDHLCRVHACINPLHLEPVSHFLNSARSARAPGSRCRRNHLYDEANSYVDPRGRRHCRACKQIANGEYRERKRTRV